MDDYVIMTAAGAIAAGIVFGIVSLVIGVVAIVDAVIPTGAEGS